MKNFMSKVQELGKKAAELKQAVQAAPAQAAELRQAVVMSAAELHQIRSDVQSNLQGLRVNNEERLLFAMREVNDAALVFEEAGYELTGVDLDLSLPQRLSVHLDKFEDVSHAALRAMATRETRETIKPILAGILKAEETAANVEFSYLHLSGVIVHVGAVPVIRMCWRTEEAVEEQTSVKPAVAPAPAPPVISAAPSSFGSFFEPRPTTAAPKPAPAIITETETAVAAAQPALNVPTPPAPEPTPVATASPWSTSALDRFKKMPDLSKHRR